MKLIFIYGPPAAGKLTVAKELAKLTKYKIFHNHLTVDLVASVIDFGTKKFWDINSKLRIELFELAAKEKVKGLIFTFCYAHPIDFNFVNKVKNKVEKSGGKVHFVHLYCETSELKKRVKNSSRKNFKKITQIKTLTHVLQKRDFFTSIPSVENLRIDNSNTSAKQVAKKIKKQYKL